MLFGHLYVQLDFPGGSDSEEFTGNAGAPGFTPGLGRSPGDGNVYPFQYFSCRIPWTEEPGIYSPWRNKEFDMTE